MVRAYRCPESWLSRDDSSRAQPSKSWRRNRHRARIPTRTRTSTKTAIEGQRRGEVSKFLVTDRPEASED